jgi:mono/diheme cytochrome c family protein
MLTRKIECPSCQVVLKVAETLPAGKKIRCPKCTVVFPLPATNGQISRPRAALPAAQSAPAGPAKDLQRKVAPPLDDDEDVDERPARKGSRTPHNTDARSPRNKPARKTPLILGLVIGAVLLIGTGVALAVVFWPTENKPPPVAQKTPPQPAPFPPGPGPGTPGPGPASGDSQEFAAGKRVFQANGCVRCHPIGSGGPSAGPGPGRGRGIDLGSVGRDPTHTVEWLMEHVRNPKAHRPDSRMPMFAGKINDEDLKALGEYLASLK